MKETKQEIATNTSAGAEKVEKISKSSTQKSATGEKEQKTTTTTTKRSQTAKTPQTQVRSQAKKSVKPADTQSTSAAKAEKSVKSKIKKENDRAKARVAAAQKRKEEKKQKQALKAKKRKERAEAKRALQEKRRQERIALQEKRRAERKALMEKRAKKRKELAEKRKAKQEEKIRARAHNKANRSEKKYREKKKRAENRSDKGEKRERGKGYGGWLAAVIALGTVTLGLTTAVTVGAIDMKKTKEGVAGGYRATAYEIVGIMENVDNDLDRARVSASPAQQMRILTDLLVQARLAELDLEKMPISAESDANLTAFINRVGFESERMLAKLRNGEKLSAEDERVLQRLYETNHNVLAQLSEYTMQMTDQDLMDYVKKGTGAIADVLESVENVTLPENALENGGDKPQREGAGMERNGSLPEVGNEESSKIAPSKAEDLCALYFASYNVGEFQCVGETVTRGYAAYNVQAYDKDGTLLFAEVDYQDGTLLRFDYYKECVDDNFTLENAQTIAAEFMSGLGYEDMVAVRARENGTDVDFTFVYEQDGVVYYPDMIKVKVCRTRGLVTGLDATRYVMHHQNRTKPEVKYSLFDAREKLHDGIEVDSARLAMVATPKGEKLAYEFLCSYKEEEYVIYTDAITGEEISIVNLKNLG